MMATFVNLIGGGPAPYFTQRSAANPRYTFDCAAGRYLVLLFFHSATMPQALAAIKAAQQRPDLFDDSFASFFGVSTDPADEAERRVFNVMPGFRFIWDTDLTVSRLYGAADSQGREGRLLWVIIDPTMRIINTFPVNQAGNVAAIGCLVSQPPPGHYAGIEVQAPILYLPRVLEPEICDQLISLYKARGGKSSGFMRKIDGKTILTHDPSHKLRKDIVIDNDALISTLQNRIRRCVVPEIAKIHMLHVTRMERYIVSCYEAAEGGHFAPHRDNTTPGTAHRQFAVSINLNEEFEGGKLSFPEYGQREFKSPKGWAIVFSCALLHTVSRVTSGRRFAFLPFLYDDAASAMRKVNATTIVMNEEGAV